jgi:tetratricopeptide (TPR) repeat protein
MRLITGFVFLMTSSGVFAQAPAPTPTAGFETERQRAEAEIARTRTGDQKLPDHLLAQIDYVALLLRFADGDCAARLADAEKRIQAVDANPATRLVLLDSQSRLATIRYSLEITRARCAGQGAGRNPALEAARKQAQEAVAGFRAVFDYTQMAVMQYNVAQASFDLGDTARAIKELEAALDFDRTFNLRDDARENFLTLRKWQGREATTEEVASFFAPFAPREAKLIFDWKPQRLTGTTVVETSSVEGEGVSRSQYTVPFTGELKKVGDLLALELTAGAVKVTSPPSSDALNDKISAAMTHVLTRLPVLEISTAGEFKNVRDMPGFAKNLGEEATTLIGTTIPADAERRDALIAAVDERLRPAITADTLLGKFRESYGLRTGIWVGATMTQNNWMEMKATLSMNGTPQLFIEHRMQFALTRWLPCAPKMAPESCVEIVVEARPVPEAVSDVAGRLAESGNGRLDYRSTTRMRITVDPKTLLCYEYDTINNSYLGISNKGKRVVEIESNRLSTKTAYRPL